MKKVLVFLLTAVLAISALSGCSGGQNGGSQKEAAETPKEITFWYWEDLEGMHKDLLENRWKQLNNNINVKFESVPQSSYHDKLVTAMSSNTGPDLFKMYPSWMPELTGMNSLVDLTDITKDWEVMKEIPEAEMVTAYAGQDRLYSLPFCNVVMYMYCRTDYFKEVGLELPQTMDDFYNACEKLTRDRDGDGKIDTYGFGLRGAKGGQDMWAGMVLNAKPDWDYVDKDGNPTLTDPELIAANEKYLNIFKNGWAPPTAPTDGFDQIVQNFKSGVTAMLVHHIGSSEGIVEAVGKENVTVVALPKGAGGRYVASIPSSLGANSQSKNKDATIELAKWIVSPEIHDVISENVQQTPYMSSVAKLEKYQSNQFHKISIDSLPDSKMNPVVPTMGQFVEKNWPQTMQRALIGEITSEQMMQILNDALKSK